MVGKKRRDPGNAQESGDIIAINDGWAKVKKDGVLMFIQSIEEEDRDYFRVEEFLELYDLIFKMCIQREPYNWSESIYERFTQSILDYILLTVHKKLDKARGQYEYAYLQEWVQRWTNFKLIVKGFTSLFMYLDRFYTPNTDGVLPLKDQSYRLYFDRVFDDKNYAKDASRFIQNAITKERNNEEQDRHLLQQAVQVFVEMGYNYGESNLKVYKDFLQCYIISHAGDYYRRVSRTWMDQDSCPIFIKKAEKCLDREGQRVQGYLHESTELPLTKECYIQLLQKHQEELLQKQTGIANMLKADTNEKKEDLSRLYRVFYSNPEDLEPISTHVKKYIQAQGSTIVDESEEKQSGKSNHELVMKLIKLHDKYASLVRDCFGNAQIFQKALRQAFEGFINRDNRVSKLLAQFVNDVLRKSTQVENIDNTLDQVVFLYGYIQEKDVFERDYQVFLSTRLLLGLGDEHDEKSMIGKLKAKCGYQWTKRLEGMFKDVQISKDLMVKYHKMAEEKKSPFQLNVTVCTTGYWPSNKQIPYKRPAQLESTCKFFTQYYLSTQSGRLLKWRMDQGQAELLVRYPKGKNRTLSVSTFQMMVLLLFNGKNMLKMSDILDGTGCKMYELENHILSLAHPKVGVLQKRPPSRTLGSNDMFKMNIKFPDEHQQYRFVVPLLKPKPTGTDRESLDEQKAIELQRRYQSDAAIVRIMKARKKLRHVQLIAEVIQMLSIKFSPDTSKIKKRIEALIESDYLKRSAKDRGVYEYVA